MKIMPKYILLGLSVPIIVFLTMYLWSKLSEKFKTRLIIIVSGIIIIGFILILTLVLT